MKKSVKGTQTEKNLLVAFAGESQARNRYTMFAKQAKKEGYEVIAKFFAETAENERQHAKQFFNYLEGGMVEITATYPAGIVGSTLENLHEAAEGEYGEWYTDYPEAAKIAMEEGFEDIALKFTQIAAIEKHHEERFRSLREVLESGAFFKKEEDKVWRCRECGHEHVGAEALEMCPVCAHPQAYQEIKSDVF
ncbi:MAG: ferritin family protein [Rikenellaceae bacterium]